MAVHEITVCAYLINNIGRITLEHLGLVKTISNPNPSGSGYMPITSKKQLCMISSGDSRKKADLYINDQGVSIKQKGGSFSYNRLQRKNLYDVYSLLKFRDIEAKLNQIDNEIRRFHLGKLPRRNRPWEKFFSETNFKALLEFLMMKGSPNVGFSSHPASLILEAPAKIYSDQSLKVFTFKEYYETYKNQFKIALRRQWIGQDSRSEHGRALAIAKNTGNSPWVFDDVVGEPRSGWRGDYPPSERKTVYFLMIEKEA